MKEERFAWFVGIDWGSERHQACLVDSEETIIADKAFDADERVLVPLATAGKAAVIPRAPRRVSRHYDRHLFKARHLIENFLASLKQFRAIATRYDKIKPNFLAAVQLAAFVIWLN